jgi:hypothetical protein
MDWIRFYINGSWDLNMTLSGMGDEVFESRWDENKISNFLTHMNKLKQTFKEETVLYRGTRVLSPTLTPKDGKVCFEMESKGFLSTSKSMDIALEFAGKKGYLHILICSKDVKHLDFEPYYRGDKINREKEILLYPGCKLSLLEKTGKTLVWSVKK